MNKKAARMLASKKGISVIVISGIPRFRFFDGTTALIDSAAGLERVFALKDAEPVVPPAPSGAVSLEGLSQEERDKKVLELQNSQCEKDEGNKNENN